MKMRGIPYVMNSHDPQVGLFCYGVITNALRFVGEDLPLDSLDFTNAMKHRRRCKLIWMPAPLQAWDMPLMIEPKTGLVRHIGLIIDDGQEMMHAVREMGSVVIEPVRKYMHRIKAVGRLRKFL